MAATQLSPTDSQQAAAAQAAAQQAAVLQRAAAGSANQAQAMLGRAQGITQAAAPAMQQAPTPPPQLLNPTAPMSPDYSSLLANAATIGAKEAAIANSPVVSGKDAVAGPNYGQMMSGIGDALRGAAAGSFTPGEQSEAAYHQAALSQQGTDVANQIAQRQNAAYNEAQARIQSALLTGGARYNQANVNAQVGALKAFEQNVENARLTAFQRSLLNAHLGLPQG